MEIDTEKKRWCVTLQKDIEKCPECGGGRYQWRSEDVSLSSQPDLVQGSSLGSFFLVVFLPVKQEQKHTFAYLLGVRMNKERVQQSACSNAYLISVHSSEPALVLTIGELQFLQMVVLARLPA